MVYPPVMGGVLYKLAYYLVCLYKTTTETTDLMRLYQPVWEQLKLKGEARVTSNAALHARIVKAVTKEKNADIVQKLLVAERYKKAVLLHSTDSDNPDVIVFTLTEQDTFGFSLHSL